VHSAVRNMFTLLCILCAHCCAHYVHTAGWKCVLKDMNRNAHFPSITRFPIPSQSRSLLTSFPLSFLSFVLPSSGRSLSLPPPPFLPFPLPLLLFSFSLSLPLALPLPSIHFKSLLIRCFHPFLALLMHGAYTRRQRRC
jgi:hypothetical protein